MDFTTGRFRDYVIILTQGVTNGRGTQRPGRPFVRSIPFGQGQTTRLNRDELLKQHAEGMDCRLDDLTRQADELENQYEQLVKSKKGGKKKG